MKLPNKVPFYWSYDDYGHMSRVALKPTGKWMLRLTHGGDLKLYIQHSTIIPFLNWWIDEEYIDWFYPKNEIVNSCSSTKY